jgi:hypothetical protein
LFLHSKLLLILLLLLLLSEKCTYECAQEVFFYQRQSKLRNVPQSEFIKIHYVDIRAAVIFGYSDFQDHLPYLNMIQGVEACRVR